MDVSAALSYGI